MRAGELVLCVAFAAAAGTGQAQAQQSAPPATEPATAAPSAAGGQAAATAPAAVTDERLVLSGNGAKLSQDHGGGGGSATFLASSGGNVLGVGVEYQEIANSHWTNGVFSGALALGQIVPRATLYVDARDGAGDIGPHAFHYTVADGGVIGTLTQWLSVQLEERYVDIDKNHGNLPKLGVSLRVAPPLLVTVSYAHSAGGNLEGRLTSVRLDYVSRSFSWLAGGAWGPVSPVVINLITRVIGPGPPLQEEYLGIGKSLGRTDWQLLADYQDIEGFKRKTLTLNCTLHLGRRP
ncbi:MAG: hypothetical protein JOZ89_09775 [Gammaproteobacteria bacterium]|nr:hypothetical protein [Gammaproteobacteria bacterium]